MNALLRYQYLNYLRYYINGKRDFTGLDVYHFSIFCYESDLILILEIVTKNICYNPQ